MCERAPCKTCNGRGVVAVDPTAKSFVVTALKACPDCFRVMRKVEPERSDPNYTSLDRPDSSWGLEIQFTGSDVLQIVLAGIFVAIVLLICAGWLAGRLLGILGV